MTKSAGILITSKTNESDSNCSLIVYWYSPGIFVVIMSFIVRHKELLPSIENTWEREKVRKRGKMMMRRRRRIGGENQTYHVIVNQSINRQEELREIEFWVPRSDCSLLAARQACIKRRIGEGRRRNKIGDVWPWCLGSKCCIPL